MEDAAKDIAEVINSNTGLEELWLNDNRLGGVGVKNLCDNVEQHTSFKLLQFSNNNITEEAADGLAEFIAYNKFLEECYIGKNSLQSSGKYQLD